MVINPISQSYHYFERYVPNLIARLVPKGPTMLIRAPIKFRLFKIIYFCLFFVIRKNEKEKKKKRKNEKEKMKKKSENGVVEGC